MCSMNIVISECELNDDAVFLVGSVLNGNIENDADIEGAWGTHNCTVENQSAVGTLWSTRHNQAPI